MRVFLTMIGIIAILAAPFLFFQAFDKYTSHSHVSASSASMHQVSNNGSDASLQILDTNYFTAFSVIGLQSLLFGLFCIGIVLIVNLMEEGSVEIKKQCLGMATLGK